MLLLIFLGYTTSFFPDMTSQNFTRIMKQALRTVDGRDREAMRRYRQRKAAKSGQEKGE